MSKNDEKMYRDLEERLKYWEQLLPSDGEKLHWLAKFNGDADAAKWAFLKNKMDKPQKISKQKPSPYEQEVLADYPEDANLWARIWRGEVNFWKLWFFGSFLPGIFLSVISAAFTSKSSTSDPYLSRVQQGNQEVAVFFSAVGYALAIYVLVGLSRSCVKMLKHGETPIQTVLAIVLVSAGWIASVGTLILYVRFAT